MGQPTKHSYFEPFRIDLEMKMLLRRAIQNVPEGVGIPKYPERNPKCEKNVGESR